MTEYKYWKWTNSKVDEPILKSRRERKKKTVCDRQETEKKELPEFLEFETIHREPSDKRAICNERISNRYMVIQTPINPFLSKSNYISDLEVQDTLLRPKDSNIKEAE